MNSSLRRLFIALALGLACAPGLSGLRAQAPVELPKKEISEAASAGFAKLQPLLDAKDYRAVLALANQLLAAAAPGSYDAYLLLQLRAQVFLDQNKLVAAIEPLERARALAEANANFYEQSVHLDRLQLLAQLHYQDGVERKTPAQRRAAFERSRGHLHRWLTESPKPSSTVRTFAATLCYSLATLDPKPDAGLLREAAGHAREALVLSTKSDGQIRLLLVACLQALGENARAAEELEVLAAAEPKSASTWSQLLSLYLNLAADASASSAAAEAWNLRALLALERAQAQGHLVSPKDNYTRIALLFNFRQFTRAAEQLEKGLAEGALEDSKRNWELLSSAYLRTGRDDRAIDAVGRAVAKFPQDGALEFSLAQFLYGAGKITEAYARGQSALAKPGIEKPGQARLYLAFLAFELQRHDEAVRWLGEARAGGDVPPSTIEPLERAIKESLAQRGGVESSESASFPVITRPRP